MEIKVNDLHWRAVKEGKDILNGIDTVIHKGGFYGILGPNGSGKTSFIRHLLRLLPLTEGTITIDREDIASYKRKVLSAKLSFVPQNTNLASTFSVYDIVMMGRAPYQGRFEGLSLKDREIVKEAMEFTKCWNLRDKVFENLSGGEAQRVITARAIAQQTPYLILDEPISHLDIRHQMELMKCLKKLNEERGTTIIAVLHDLNLAYMFCENVILMKEGQIFKSGHREEVMTTDNLLTVYEMDFTVVKHPDSKEDYFIPRRL